MPSAPILDQGMPIEVMKDFDTVLLFGRLTSVRLPVLAAERIPGESNFPICEIGSAVLVRGYDARMEPVLLRGRVITSSGMRCVVGDLEAIPYETPRKNIRYPLAPPVGVCILDGASGESPEPCQLLNLSTGGACIVSKYSYQVKQTLSLRIELDREAGRSAIYQCRVVRATPRSRRLFEYGLFFIQMDENDHSVLMQILHTIREETEKKLRA